MATNTTSLLNLDQKLLEATGDWLQVTVTTAIAAAKHVTSTELINYDQGQNGRFDNRWVYIEDYANAGTERLFGSTSYSTATGTAYVWGANLLTDSANLATVRISYSSWSERKDCILRAIDENYPALHRRLDDRTLILGNALPNGHFEDQTTSGTPDKWAFSNASGAKETTNTRGGTNAIKVTASSGNGYITLKSDNWRRILDLQGKTVSFKCWALPEMANDATLVIYTKQADGTAQTLSSTTTCPAGEFTLLELEDQTLNDNLVELEFRCKVTTNTKYVIFDDARVTGEYVHDYLLPVSFQRGYLSRAERQTFGSNDDICDDISLSVPYEPVYGKEIVDDGSDKFLRIPYDTSGLNRLRLIGYQPLESLSAASDTITLSAEKVQVIIAKAAYLLVKKLGGPVGADDTEKYQSDMAMFDYDYRRLLTRHRMQTPTQTMDVTPL